jgi:DNA-binding response OmpR family regulator
MKKIIIADDEELIRRLVADFLKKEGYDALQAEDGTVALALFEQNPDTALVILDVMMPQMDGWECCRRIKEKKNVPVIMLTARSQEFDELMGFEAGADDYVTKPFSPTVLMKRVSVILKRGIGETELEVLSLDGLKVDQNAHSVRIGETNAITLTLKEYNILVKLLSNLDKVFTREALLNEIWGFDFYGDVRTVDSHVARLRTKLGQWGTDQIKTIYCIGYKIEPGESND